MKYITNIRFLLKYFHNHSIIFVSILFFILTLIIFNGVLKGKIISNINYLYSFEPWIHLEDQPPDRGNFILSDMVDGVGSRIDQLHRMKMFELPLWDYSDKLGTIGVVTILNDWFYPIRTLNWLVFDPALGWTIEILLKFFLGSLFTYLYLRLIGINQFIAFAISIGFAFGANNISEHQAGFSTVPLTIPITLYFIEKLFRKTTWKNTLPLILSGILLLSAGFISISFFACFWLTVYVLIRLIFYNNKRFDTLVKFGFSALFILLIFSIALIPTIDFFKNGIDLRYRSNYGLAQLEPITLTSGFFANIFGHPLRESQQYNHGSFINTSIYVGFISLLLVISISLNRLYKTRDFYTSFFLFVVIFLLFDIYDFNFENIEKITNSLPFFNGNRPTYQKTVFQFFLSLLAALNLQYLWDLGAIKKRLINMLPIIITLFCLLFYAIFNFYVIISNNGFTLYESKYFIFFSILAVFQLILLICILFRSELSILIQRIKVLKNVLRNSPKLISNLLGLTLVLVFIIEAFYNQRGWITYTESKFWFPETEVVNYIKSHIGPSRVVPVGSGVAVPAVLSAYGIPTAAGRGSVPEPYELLLQTTFPDYYLDAPTQTIVRDPVKFNFNSQLWYLLDVKYFIVGKWFDNSILNQYGDQVELREFNDGKIIELTPNPNHAYLAFDGIIFSNYDEMAQRFKNDWDINQKIALFENNHLLENDSPNEDSSIYQGSVTSFAQKSNQFEIETVTTGPSYLVISSQYHPGWKAYLDGERIDTFAAYGFLQAVKIEGAGKHTIILKFLPDSVIWGLSISILSTVILIVFYRFKLQK